MRTYSRGELIDLRAESIIAARPQLGAEYRYVTLPLLFFPQEEGSPSKTHQFDDSVVLDPLSRRMAQQVAPGEALVKMPAEKFRNFVAAAVAMVGLAAWQVTPYLRRQAGPSQRHLSRDCTMPVITRRGRWSSERSVRRYEKSSQVNARFAKLPKDTLALLRMRSLEVEAIFAGEASPSRLLKTMMRNVTSSSLGRGGKGKRK